MSGARLSPSRVIVLVAGAAVACAAVWTLGRELAAVSPRDLSLAVSQISATSLVLAGLLTAASYLVLTEYEQLAFQHAGVSQSRWKVAFVSFVGHAFANTVGVPLLTGSAVRYRYYARWHLSRRQIAGIVAFYSGTFWLGLLVFGGWGLWRAPVTVLPDGLSTEVHTLGALLASSSFLYLLASAFGPRLRIGRREYAIPGWRMATAQYLLSMLDWLLSAGVFWVLLPDPAPPFAQVSLAFVVAQLFGVASHLPGGIGAFEVGMAAQLKDSVGVGPLLATLVAFRSVYYLAPLVAATLAVAADEYRRRRSARAATQPATIACRATALPASE